MAPVIAEIAGVRFDTNTLNALILVHDLPEFGMERDVTVLEQVQDHRARKRKDDIEAEKIVTLANTYGQWMKDLFDEYREQEMNLQNLLSGWINMKQAVIC